MADYLSSVIDAARGWDLARPRTQQTQVGWSGVAGCRAYLGYQIAGEWPTDQPDEWRSIVGSALHQWLQMVRGEAFTAAGVSFSHFSHEHTIDYRGIPGHADEILWNAGEVIDWKFPTLASAAQWEDEKVRDERFAQPQGYAAGVVGGDRWRAEAPDPDGGLVRVLLAPVDGTFDDWRMYERPFDRAFADHWADRYEHIAAMQAAGEPLPKDKPYVFCKRFCEMFSLCRGEDTGEGLPDLSADPELATMIAAYGEATEKMREAEAVKDRLYRELHGYRGVIPGWKITTSRPGRGSYVDDTEAIHAMFAEWGLEVPQRLKEGSAGSLSVSRVKSP
jgi:hypothetical protein